MIQTARHWMEQFAGGRLALVLTLLYDLCRTPSAFQVSVGFRGFVRRGYLIFSVRRGVKIVC
jgi:hypothetical protein